MWQPQTLARLQRPTAFGAETPGATGDLKVEYKYCQTCGGAMSERIEYASDGYTITSWLRYEYDGLNLLRIDERYDGENPAGLDENDPWRPLNVFIHGPGAIGQIVKCKWYNYYSDGQNPTSCCDSGEYYYFYDALGNVNGVLDSGGHYYRWEIDAFGNDLPGGNAFLAMDQPGPKEHLTGKMFDTTTGLYYFASRWYDPQVGRFVSRDKQKRCIIYANSFTYSDGDPVNYSDPDGNFRVVSGKTTSYLLDRPPFSKPPKCLCSQQELQDIRRSTEAACSKIDTLISPKSKELADCLKHWCDRGVITCVRECGGSYGVNLTFGALDRPVGTRRLGGGTFKMCLDTMNRDGVTAGQVAMHEWGHGCSCTHSRRGGQPPDDYAPGGPCDVLPSNHNPTTGF